MKNILLLSIMGAMLMAILVAGCEKITSNAWKELKTCPDEPTVEIDGKTYNTVQIGEQCWMAENVDVGTMLNTNEESTDNGILEKYCYKNDPSNCETYGGLYKWEEITQYLEGESSKGICPDGWAIPDEDDWAELNSMRENYPNAKGNIFIEASEDYWEYATDHNTGSNATGFTAMPAGILNANLKFTDKGTMACFWTTEKYKSSRISFGWRGNAFQIWEQMEGDALSLRCIKKNAAPILYTSPEDDTDNFPVNGKLEWETFDEDGQQVYVTLYLKKLGEAYFSIVLENSTKKMYIPNNLQYGIRYYWKVLATDGTDTVWSPEKMFRTVSEPCTGMSQVVYNGQTYNTVKIGSQCWMRENLNVGDMINSSQNSTDNGIIEKYCRDNDTANCQTYGGLYTWHEMMEYSQNNNGRGICPDGWHVASKQDWIDLRAYIGGGYNSAGMLKEIGTSHWQEPNTNANNKYGFTALPNTNDPNYKKEARIWSSTSFSSQTRANLFKAFYNNSTFFFSEVGITNGQVASVRCVYNY